MRSGHDTAAVLSQLSLQTALTVILAFIKKAAWLFDGKLRFGGAFYYTSAFEDPVSEYECFDVAPWLEQFNEIALLKINIEGGEYDLLTHIIDRGHISRIKHLQVQFHLIEGQRSEEHYDLVVDSLKDTHESEWRYPFCWESWRRI